MKSLTHRREFLQTSLRASLALAGLRFLPSTRLQAIEPIQRPGGARFKLSLVAYSFRKYLTAGDPAKNHKDVVDHSK